MTTSVLTTSACIDYTRAFFADRVDGFESPAIIHGARMGEEPGTRDVLFRLDGHAYVMTCWLDEHPHNGLCIYGEW